MAYLHNPKIIFSGDFKADVSTVNNDVRHYDNDSFESRFQDTQDNEKGFENGWWNPDGTSNFRMINCRVTKGFLPDREILANDEEEIVINALVTEFPDTPSGKIVDLDPQMQGTSELWALKIRLTTAGDRLLVQGDVAIAGFRDIQRRQFPETKNDKEFDRNKQPLSATWNTVIYNLEWGDDVEHSAILKALRSSTHRVAGCQLLSLSLTTFGFYYTHLDGRFSMGKLIGVIGPWFLNEPKRFFPGRRLYGTVGSYLRYSNFIIHEPSGNLILDLGNSYPLQDPLGAINKNFPEIILAISRRKSIEISQADPNYKFAILPENFKELATISPVSTNWLLESGGIVSVKMTADDISRVKDHQVLLIIKELGNYIIYARESIEGLYIRADENVLRLDPGDQFETSIYAYQWGKPLSFSNIELSLMEPLADQGIGEVDAPNQPKAFPPLINCPVASLAFPEIVKTNESGVAKCLITSQDPGNYRKYIDGQIYLLRYNLKGAAKVDQYFGFGMIMDLLFIHLRDAFTVPETPTWDDVKEIWAQFGNLYPIMNKYLLNMHSMDEIVAHKDILLYAFKRSIYDPVYMPVTRDLSENKRKTLIKWLENPLEGTVDAVNNNTLGPSDVGSQQLIVNRVLGDKLTEQVQSKGGPGSPRSIR